RCAAAEARAVATTPNEPTRPRVGGAGGARRSDPDRRRDRRRHRARRSRRVRPRLQRWSLRRGPVRLRPAPRDHHRRGPPRRARGGVERDRPRGDVETAGAGPARDALLMKPLFAPALLLAGCTLLYGNPRTGKDGGGTDDGPPPVMWSTIASGTTESLRA